MENPSQPRPRHSRTAIIPAIVVLSVVATSLAASVQGIAVIPDEPSCPSCTVSLQLWTTLEAPEDQGICRYVHVAVDSRGYTYVGPDCTGWRVFVYDDSGKYVRMMGARGQGPGELQGVEYVTVDSRNQLHVFEAFRRHVFSPDGLFLFSRPNPGRPSRALEGPNGALYEQITFRAEYDAGRATQPLHLVTADGRVALSFGRRELNYRADIDEILMERDFAVTPGGDVWSLTPNRYELDLYSAEGRFLRGIERVAPWFREWSVPEENTSRMMSLHIDEEGRLWTLAAVANGNQYHSIIEVLNSDTGELVARKSVDEIFSYWVGRRVLWRRRELPNDDYAIELWKAQMRGQDPR